jgi:FtsH-binding integral membrane protein
MSYAMEYPLAFQASESERAAFIRRTYAHLAGAILAFVGLECLIFTVASQVQLGEFILNVFARSPWSALLVVGGFIAISYLAQWWATQGGSPAMQYAGLSLYVVAEAVIFLPLLYLAVYAVNDKTIIPTAGILTLSMFGGLSAAAFVTRKDFSFLGPILSISFFVVLGLIVCAILIPGAIHLGMWFSLLLIVLASASILYQTSNVIHHYRTDQHVAAALALFAAVAMLFYYILRLLIQLQGGSRD